jgi:hypothetical protein
MNKVRAIAIAALGFLGIGAVAGGLMLILDPTGKRMGMPLSFLDHSPFHSFLIPGIILLVSNGLLPLAIMMAAMRRSTNYGWWVAFQGCVLTGWITVEVIMMRVAAWPHYIYWGLGLALIALGLALTRGPRTL